MNKNEVIDKLRSADYESGIAEVICDIVNSENVCYPNKSILVLLWGYGEDDSACNDDQIVYSKHFAICGGIDDFEENIVYGTNVAKEDYCNYYVSEFKEVKPFVSDFVKE